MASAVALACSQFTGCAPGSSDIPTQNSREAPADAYIKGALAYQQHDLDKAILYLEQSLRSDPKNIMAHQTLGNIYRDKQDYPKALEHYRFVAEMDPYVYTNHYNVAITNHLLDHIREAVVSYLRALKLKPSDMRSNMNIGLAYASLGRADLGVPYSQKAVEIDPKSPEAWGNLAVVLDEKHDYGAAEPAYQKALELDANRLDVARNFGANLIAQGKGHQATAVYEEILRKLDNTQIRERYGRALLLAERPEDAFKEFSSVFRREPRNLLALNGMGDAMIGQYERSNQVDDAKRIAGLSYYRKSLSIKPVQPRISEMVRRYEQGGILPHK